MRSLRRVALFGCLGRRSVHISRIFGRTTSQNATPISFRVFPPGNRLSLSATHRITNGLYGLSPDFISIAYSTNNSNGNTAATPVTRVVSDRFSAPSITRLAYINHSRTSVTTGVNRCHATNIRGVLTLHNSLPTNTARSSGPTSSCTCTHSLVPRLISTNFYINTTTCPRNRVTYRSLGTSIRCLGRGRSTNTDFFIARLFFSGRYFCHFHRLTSGTNVAIPVATNVVPFVNGSRVDHVIFVYNTSLPSPIVGVLTGCRGSPRDLRTTNMSCTTHRLYGLGRRNTTNLRLCAVGHPTVTTAVVRHLKW